MQEHVQEQLFVVPHRSTVRDIYLNDTIKNLNVFTRIGQNNSMTESGLTIVYTGNGKGKTTA